MNIKQYKNVDHPFHLPGDMDLFSWSMPFLAEKVTEMLFHIVGHNAAFSPKSAKELDQIDFSKMMIAQPNDKETKREILRTKVKTVARMMKLFRNLRENRDMLLMIKGVTPDNKIPKGLIMRGPLAIKTMMDEFDSAKEMDRENEKFPTPKASAQPYSLMRMRSWTTD